MKINFLIFTFAFFCVSTVFSQSWFAGGNISVQYNSDNKDTTIELSPEIGFRINNKFDLGLNPLFGYRSYYEEITFGIGVFARYSFFEINRFSILGRFGLEYLNMDNEINAFGIYIEPVFQYRLLDKFSLYASIGSIYYSHIWSDGRRSSNNFGLNLSSNISLGFYILFGSSRNDRNEDDKREERPQNTAMDPDKFIFGISANLGGFLSYIQGALIGTGAGGSLTFEFGKGNFNSEINLMLPLNGFGFLATFNGFWPSRIGGAYFGGGVGYSFYDYYGYYGYIAHSLAIGLNAGYKFVTKSGFYVRTGAFVGFDFGFIWGDGFPVYIKPDLAIGWTMR